MRPSASIKRLQPWVRAEERARRIPLRECVPVGDVTDCLSAAYECVSRAPAAKAVAGDMRDGLRESAEGRDARKARNQKIPWLIVDVTLGDLFIYALASVPGCVARNISIGLEPGWLAILAEPEDCARDSREHITGGAGCAGAGHTFCVMSLPSEVDPLETTAVLAKGLLGIRMRKAHT